MRKHGALILVALVVGLAAMPPVLCQDGGGLGLAQIFPWLSGGSQDSGNSSPSPPPEDNSSSDEGIFSWLEGGSDSGSNGNGDGSESSGSSNNDDNNNSSESSGEDSNEAGNTFDGNVAIKETLQNPIPRPAGGPITVTTEVEGTDEVFLIYVVNYGDENRIPMERSGDGNTFAAVIAAEDARPGNMIRWAVEAGNARDPVLPEGWNRKYYGTIVEDTDDKSNLPKVEFYCEDEEQPFVLDRNVPPSCSVWINNEFFDNIRIRRRGESSLKWPKPKFKVEAGDEQGRVFRIDENWPRVEEFNMNSGWYEPGENTFMRDTLAWRTFKEMGVDHIVSYQTSVRMNGKYYGKFSLHDDWTKKGIERMGYSVEPEGPRFKAQSGTHSNFRWDLPAEKVPFFWNQTGVESDEYKYKLVDFSKGVSGGAELPRSKYLFDKVNLPKIINFMAAQTLILHQDRCTKNFIAYYEPGTDMWSVLPWDMDAAFGIDRGLGGKPTTDYCILACERFNTPLYCDRDHPQDLEGVDPEGFDEFFLNPAGGQLEDPAVEAASKDRRLRRLFQENLEDEDLTQQPIPEGAAVTFNYLIDAILAVSRTKQMYLRRLRTLMDQFTNGRLEELVTDEYNKIREETKRDQALWNSPWDVDRGYEQLMTEQLPIRKSQLYDVYGPGGPRAMIPGAQPSNAPVSVIAVETGSSGYIEIYNDNEFAVDISGWKMSGAGVDFTFVSGTVIPPGDSVYVAKNIQDFKNANGGQGLFVVGPFSGDVNGGASDITISSAF